MDRPSITTFMEKAHESVRERVKTLIERGLYIGNVPIPDRPSLSQCLEFLGRMQIRLHILEQVTDILTHSLCRTLPCWSQETWSLRELSQRQIKTMVEMVDMFISKDVTTFDELEKAHASGNTNAA